MNLVKYKTGLVVGAFFALCHLLWLVLVITGVAQVMMDWILKLHMLNNPMLVQPFDFANAGMLLVMTFAVGFVAGWVFALFCNLLRKK
ncbi:MAG: hypothetical protein WC285_03445 [Candidatus Gracilibacteria bacterium]|jgi:hypothetical protein